jgi:hypothetical protein
MWKLEWLTNAGFFSKLTSTPDLDRVTFQVGETALATKIRNTPRPTS